MVTNQMAANPTIKRGVDEMEINYSWGKVSRRVDKCRGHCALTVLFFGLGVLLFAIGLCTGLFSTGLGVVGLTASWVVALVLREYLGTWEYYDTIEYKNE